MVWSFCFLTCFHASPTHSKHVFPLLQVSHRRKSLDLHLNLVGTGHVHNSFSNGLLILTSSGWTLLVGTLTPGTLIRVVLHLWSSALHRVFAGLYVSLYREFCRRIQHLVIFGKCYFNLLQPTSSWLLHHTKPERWKV